MKLKPPTPTDVWTDENGKTWYEYSACDIIEYELKKFAYGLNRENRANNRPSTGQPRVNIPLEIV